MLEARRLIPGEWAIHTICGNLRPEDLYEVHAIGWTPGQLPYVIQAAQQMGEAWMIYWRAEPIFIWGANRHLDGVYGLWGFGTSATRRAMPAITRWGMKTWLPDFLARTKARRIEVRVPVSSVHSINWLKRLGMIPEATLPHYSVIGEDFLQLAYTAKFEVNPYVSPRSVLGTESPSSHSSAH